MAFLSVLTGFSFVAVFFAGKIHSSNHLRPLNIRTCNLLSHGQELMDGMLSDYWAQELIGSDLLRKELENAPPFKRPNWIAVFDILEGYHNTK